MKCVIAFSAGLDRRAHIDQIECRLPETFTRRNRNIRLLNGSGKLLLLTLLIVCLLFR